MSIAGLFILTPLPWPRDGVPSFRKPLPHKRRLCGPRSNATTSILGCCKRANRKQRFVHGVE